jgi:hypothetical protein
MVSIIIDYNEKRLDGETKGRKHALSVEDEVIISLLYLRIYTTHFFLGGIFGIDESTSFRAERRVERALLISRKFSLPKRRVLSEEEFTKILVDVMEIRIERPKRKQKRDYSGKRKAHTKKAQVILDGDRKEILSVDLGNGRMHDFRLFKESKGKINPNSNILTDKGYTGIHKFHNNSFVPKKNAKKKPLTKDERKENRRINSVRVSIEHVFSRLKAFKVLGTKYRGRRKNLGLRLNLIAGIYNHELLQTG